MKLNIGSGITSLPGFTNWDIKGGHQGYPLDVPDGSVEEIYVSHLLEHFSHRETLNVLRDWFRALQPGGRLRVAVPDLHKIVQWYVDSEESAKLEAYLFGGQVDEHDYHKASFNAAKLTQALELAGFVAVQPWTSEIPDCSALPVSLNLEARKPGGDIEDDATVVRRPARGMAMDEARRKELSDMARGIVAVWTTPRYMLSATVDSVYRALPPLGIKLQRQAGVFWDQCLEIVFNSAIEGGADGILCLDYDSVFEPADLHRLIELYRANPDVAAVCPMQWARSIDKPLWNRFDADGEPCWPDIEELQAASLVDVDTAHFGLSILRVSALQDLPRPWFHHVPDENGRWDSKKKRDADIAFWLKLRAAGHRLCIAPEVTIGHIEEMVVWPGPDLHSRHQYIFDYQDIKRPDFVFTRQPNQEETT